MKPNNTVIERRFHTGPVEVRAAADGSVSRAVRGYAAKFNSPSENLGGFIEVIAPGAFDGVLEDDVRALFNHEPDHILARTKSKTLRIGVDETGLWYEFDAPETTAGSDLLVALRRGDIDQSSFGFTVAPEGDDWQEHPDNPALYLRTIKKVGKLYDVSPVTFPAYADTESSARQLTEARARIAAATPPPPTPPAEPTYILTGARAARFGLR